MGVYLDRIHQKNMYKPREEIQRLRKKTHQRFEKMWRAVQQLEENNAKVTQSLHCVCKHERMQLKWANPCATIFTFLCIDCGLETCKNTKELCSNERILLITLGYKLPKGNRHVADSSTETDPSPE